MSGIIYVCCLCVGFFIWYVYFTIVKLKHKKLRNKRNRRNRIILKSWRIVHEITKWEIDHPTQIKANESPKGKTVFKGNSNLMNEKEFERALRVPQFIEGSISNA